MVGSGLENRGSEMARRFDSFVRRLLFLHSKYRIKKKEDICMGISCKPIGKLAGLHRKVKNEQLKEQAAEKAKKSKK